MKKRYEEHLQKGSIKRCTIHKDEKYISLNEFNELGVVINRYVLDPEKDYDIQIRENNKLIIIEKERAEQ